MLKSKKNCILSVFLIGVVAAILIGGIVYLAEVRQSLWNLSVTDILEVTAQGGHALDTYIEKDAEALHGLAKGLSAEDSNNYDIIQKKMELFGTMESSVACINLDSGIIYTESQEERRALKPEQIAQFQNLSGHGVLEPFLDMQTGVWTLSSYECFSFADGARGVIQKSKSLAEIAQQFSLSFFNDTGFSYVVNQEGDILIRSQHRNSNRTFQNLFDIIDLQGNNNQAVQSFSTALKQQNFGVARFEYQKEEYVFCYVPMNSAPGWYVVSIIPNRVIMEQAEKIIHNSQLFYILIIFSICILGAFVFLYRNSTRRIVLAEEQARKAAESANLAKSRFLSNMSHDIRTPMNAIVGMARLADDHLEDPEKVKGYLKNIEQSGQLLVSLINDILDLSKIESGKMLLNNDAASLEDLLNNLEKLIRPASAQKKQHFEIRLHQIEHKVLCFDALRLNQLLINLLSNAVKFTPECGRITMDVTEEVSKRENFAHLTFRVEDTGIGMSPDFAAHIFESFTREQDSRINKIEGSGLGMAIAKMIVDLMEGTICVESTSGEGTVFTVNLDFALPSKEQEKKMSEEAESSSEEDEIVDLAGKHVLLAEDNQLNQLIVKELLQDRGMLIDIVGDGQSCVDYFAQSAPGEIDLILMDVHMPIMNGYEATRTIRRMEREDAATIPIFAMTADAFTEDREEAKRAGMNAHLSKPVNIQHMLHEMKKYLNA